MQPTFLEGATGDGGDHVSAEAGDVVKASLAADSTLAILHAEYERCQAAIRALSARMDRLLGVGVALFGAAFGLGLHYGIPQAIIAGPPGFLGLLLYVSLLGHESAVLGGYSRWLEEEVNARLGRAVIRWESVAQAILPKARPVQMWFAFMAVLTVVFLGWGALEAMRQGSSWLAGYGALCLLGLAGTARSVASYRPAMQKAFDLASASSGKGPS